MPSACPHGLDPGECLICATLARPGSAPPTVRAAPVPAAGRRRRRRNRLDAGAAAHPEPVPAPPGRSVGLHLAGLVAGLAVIGFIAWIVAGLLFAVFHLIEIVLVAGFAGWAGYRLGLYRGARRR